MATRCEIRGLGSRNGGRGASRRNARGPVMRALHVVLLLVALACGAGGCSSCGESKPTPSAEAPPAATSAPLAAEHRDGGRRHPLRWRGPHSGPLLGGDDGGLPRHPPPPPQ